MKYMLIMRAVDQAKVEQYQQRPFEEIIAEMIALDAESADILQQIRGML